MTLAVNCNQAEAIGFEGLGVKAGVDLTRHQAVDVMGQVGGEFDSARFAYGGYLDLGSIFTSKLHLVPGGDMILESNLKIFTMNLDAVFFFHDSESTKGYAGAGIGTHLYRAELGPNDTKISLNLPLGFQKKLGSALAWFGELKLIIADDESDSSFRFSVGFRLGK
jgi:hypothetical protein